MHQRLGNVGQARSKMDRKGQKRPKKGQKRPKKGQKRPKKTRKDQKRTNRPFLDFLNQTHLLFVLEL